MSFPNPQNQPQPSTQTEDVEAAVPAQYSPVRRAPLAPGAADQATEEPTGLARVDLDDEPAWQPSQPQDTVNGALPTRQSM
ncbi:MAG: hypothetical protein LBU50_04295, partial [Cellulomonas sp.]|nr:hypothetical protein [Cellulomonas sp.]